MHIIEIPVRSANLAQALLTVWEKSVRATHLFLSESEIGRIKGYVPQALGGIENLIIAGDSADKPAAFMGIEAGRLEMLFIAPEERGKGWERGLFNTE